MLANRLHLKVLCATLLATAPASAVLTVDSQFDGGIGELPTMTIRVHNNGSAAEVYGWSVRLQIMKSVDATGELEFDTAVLPSSNYLFAGRSDGLLHSSPHPPTVINYFDSDTGGGIAVPPTANLLSVTFNSINAFGEFKVFAVGSAFGGTSFTTNADGFPTMAFDNVAFGQSVELGTVTVVPETSAFLLVAVVGLAYWAMRKRAFSTD